MPLADPQQLSRLDTAQPPAPISLQCLHIPCHPYLGLHPDPPVWNLSKNRTDRLLPNPDISSATDTESNAHLWAERFDRNIDNLLVLQNEITNRIANALGVELINREAVRPVERPDALDYILQGRAAFSKPPSRDNHEQAVRLFERALTLDPQSVEAKSWLAVVLSVRVLDGMTGSKSTDIARANELVAQVLAASPRNPLIQVVKGTVLRAQNRCAEA